MKTKKIVSLVAIILAVATMVGCSKKESESVIESKYSSVEHSVATSSMSNSSVSSSAYHTSTKSSFSSVTSTLTSTVSSVTSNNTVSSVESTVNKEPVVSTPVNSDTEINPQPVEQEWTEEEFSATMYVNTNAINSRIKPVQGSDTIKLYGINDEVSIIAKTNTGYYKLKDGTFIHQDYLNLEKIKNPEIHEPTSYPNNTGNTSSVFGDYQIGDKTDSGYTVIGLTSDGKPYIALDERYEMCGAVIFDYDKNGKPLYTEDPKKKQEILDKILEETSDNITMNG